MRLFAKNAMNQGDEIFVMSRSGAILRDKERTFFQILTKSTQACSPIVHGFASRSRRAV